MKWIPAVVASVLLLPLLAAAAPLSPEPPLAALADRDDDGLSDDLQEKLAEALSGDRFKVIVTFSEPGNIAWARRAVGEVELEREFEGIDGYAATVTAAQAEALARMPGVFRVEEDFKVSINMAEARPDFGADAAQVFGGGTTGAGVGICVVDTGVDPNHEQLNGKTPIPFCDVIANNCPATEPGGGWPSAYDDHGHGTHVAAIAAGDGIGGSKAYDHRGVAPDAVIFAAKVLDSGGSGSASGVIAGVNWCAAQPGVHVISMSLGSSGSSDGLDALSQAVNAAVALGKVVVVAAGNAGPSPYTIASPAAAADAITVGAAANPFGDGYGPYLASFSGRGPTADDRTKPDILAPGVRIRSAQAGSKGGYVSWNGTSMATPFTSGAIALALEAAPALLTPQQVKDLMQATAQDRGPPGVDNESGAGLLDVYALVAEASGPGPGGYPPTAFPTYERILGSVVDGGQWLSDPIVVTADDVAEGIPIAATVTIDGALTCFFGNPIWCDWFGGWEWGPDLDADLVDAATNTPIGANPGDITLSECVFAGEWCGYGRQETLHYVPTAPGTYKVRVYSFSGAGTFAVDLSRPPMAGTGDAAPVTVPNVVGLAEAAASTAITGAGLTVGAITEQSSDTVPSGDVISQNPLAGASVPPASAVALWVSTGPAPVGVGTVFGKVQDSTTGSNLQGVLVATDMGQTATTDKRGKYKINNVPEGSRTLTFSMTGYVTKIMNSVTVNAGSTTRNVNTTFDPDGGGGGGGGGTGTVKGTVLDSSRAKVQGALVAADTGQEATTNKGGKYNLQSVPAGARILTVSKSGCTDNVLNVTVIDGVTVTLPYVEMTCL